MQLPSASDVQFRLATNRPLLAAVTGITLGLSAAILALLLVWGGPLIALGAVLGAAVAVYILTDLMAALYVTIAVVGLLPFGTLPVKVALVPTFIDAAMGSFVVVYLFQWMTRRRADFRLVPAHALIVIFVGFTIFSFVAGLVNAAITTTTLRKFAELILSISFAIILVDVARDVKTLRRIALVLIVIGAVQAAVGLFLYVLNDVTAERLLNALGRFGYPAGGVIRYINDDPTLAERAIGTWVDPNAYGGFLLMIGALTAAQIPAEHPLTGRRWIAFVIFGLVGLTLYLTQSRGAAVALGAAIMFIAAMRYRWFVGLMIVALALILLLPFTRDYIDRFVEGVSGQDISTQMRFGEIKDALILVGRYPLIGVGFTGTPERDIYLGVSMLYLKIAQGMGLVGLSLFLLIVAEVFRYGLRRWSKLVRSPQLMNVWLGFAAGLVGAMVSGFFDHYYFNFDFQGAVTMFWAFVALALASAYLADEPTEGEAVGQGIAL